MTGQDESGDPVKPSLIQRSSLPRIEFRKSQRRDLTFYLAAELAAWLSWIVRLLPDRFVDFVARRIGDFSWVSSKLWRANVSSNISHVLDLPENSSRVQRTARSIFQANALNVATLLRSPHQGVEEFDRRLTFPHQGWDVLDRAVERGKGVIVLTAHLGSFDTMGSALSVHGYPLAALTARTTNRFAFEFVSFLRQSHRVELIEASSTGVREAITRLRDGKVLCLLSDRDFFVNGREVAFFGEKTTLPVGAARMARDTGATIVPIFTIRHRGGHALLIEPSFRVEKTADREADVAAAMEKIVHAMEEAISIAPDQWVMFQRVWPEGVPISTE